VEKTRAALQADSLLAPLVSTTTIVACPGTTYCRHAIADTHAAEALLRNSCAGQAAATICISGCPNGCAHSAVAELGLIGRIRTSPGGSLLRGFQILKGGGFGITPELARRVEEFVPADEISRCVMGLLDRPGVDAMHKVLPQTQK